MTKSFTILVVTLGLLFASTSYAKAPVDYTHSYTPNRSIASLVERYTAIYGIPNQAKTMLKVIQCESGGNSAAYNPKDTDGLPAIGILQYKKQTFLNGAKQIGIEKPDIWNPEQQIEVAAYYWSNGHESMWGCY